MAWTTPRTWTIGETVTKAIMDTHIRDNQNYLKDRIAFFDERLTNTSYDGDAVNIGTYTFAANTFNASIPTTARALFVSVSAKWAAASDGSFLNIRNGDAPGGNGIVVRSQVANFFQDGAGLVTLSATGEFKIIVGGANALAVFIDVWGYVIP